MHVSLDEEENHQKNGHKINNFYISPNQQKEIYKSLEYRLAQLGIYLEKMVGWRVCKGYEQPSLGSQVFPRSAQGWILTDN